VTPIKQRFSRGGTRPPDGFSGRAPSQTRPEAAFHLWPIALLAFLGVTIPALANTTTFHFGSGAAAPGQSSVRAATVYDAARGHGFEAGATIADHAESCSSDRPFFFSVDLPEGNYRVKLVLGEPTGATHTSVKAESRRLMVESVDTQPGETASATFLVNLRTPLIPGGGQVRLKPREIGALHWDKRLTLEFNGARPCIKSIEITKVDDAITVFLAGDSTVTDQQIEPWAAWGQMLPPFFDDRIAVANHAESGETIKSFVGERRFDRVMSLIKAGDYLFMQFAHNDQKLNAEHTDAATGYKDLLRRFITETRAKGAHPVLVTSMERRNFDAAGQHIVPSLEGYPQAMREVGAELNVPVIDLNAMSIPFYEALGPEAAKKAFVHFPANSYPGQDKELADDTHFSSYGAYQLARCVVEGIKARVPALAAHLRPGVKPYDPAHPDAFADWRLPASPPKPVVRPEGS
jgi:lysophospholipase L1-like esterase